MNLLLSFVWAALTGKFSYGNFIFGFTLSYIILWILNRDQNSNTYFKRVPNILGFLVFFVIELVKANIQVAYDVVTPRNYMLPGIVAIPLDAESDMEITMLANFISLTPGTLSLDVSDDKKTLYVHAMYLPDKNKFIADIKNGFERRLLEILR
jgi:multicomponent Na+:H+ antiporter subunit E